MGISKINSEIYYSREIEKIFTRAISSYPPGKIFLIDEDNVRRHCRPLLGEVPGNFEIKEITLPAGEQNKSVKSVAMLWEFLSKNGADRKSLLINLGGGMLTDLAGFAASTFKRGISFINIPTTLLSQVDASVGGKTGINFYGLKNEVGTFREPDAVIINVDFLKTIDHDNFISGYAEMIKHGLIHSPAHLDELMDFYIHSPDYGALEKIIRHSVEVKKYFVENDPVEKGLRKALNFGHTAGHAFESLAMEQNRPILHGFAVACGMITELFLSVKKCGFNKNESIKLADWIINLYGKFIIKKTDFERLYNLMTHDKKNEAGRINFTLVPEPGKVKINCDCRKNEIYEALEFYSSFQK